MPRQVGQAVEKSFIKGLITELTALQFPTNACTETYDCVFNQFGTVSRRAPFLQEVDGTTKSVAKVTNQAITEYEWGVVAGTGTISFVVQQIGDTLYFYDVSTDVGVSPNAESFTVDLNDFVPSGSSADPATTECQYAMGNGDLIVVNPSCDPFYVSYDVTGPSFSATAIDLKLRDFVGVDDGLKLTERPTSDIATLKTDNPEHYYNLLNQGWAISDAFTQWDSARADLPSNADFVARSRQSDTDAFSDAVLTAAEGGNSPAAKGHFILPMFDQDRNQAMIDGGFTGATLTDPDQITTYSRPSTVAFFASRVFFAGTDALGLNNVVAFSQIIRRKEQYAYCYQANDPSGENFNDLLADDGGVVKIPEAGRIVRIFPYQTQLLVFATNGVWIIGGTTGNPFSATDYSVRKISSVGTNCPLSFVDFKGVPVWWAEDGIYVVNYQANYDSYAVESMSNTTIASFFDAVPAANRRYVKGCYDIETFCVRWLFNADTNPADNYTYNRVLVMNGLSQAFYPWTISDNNWKVRGLVYVRDAARSETPMTKYTITKVNGANLDLSYADQSRTADYLDWTTEDYSSYFITGYRLDAQAIRNFQSNYIYVFMEAEESSSCFMNAVWDFSNSGNSGKWSRSQQIYRDRAYRDVNWRRLKARGSGKALQLRFRSETQKPFNIIGWSIWETSNASI